MLQKILAGATVMPLLLACAPFAQAGMQTMSPEQVSLVDTTCTQVMGLKRGEYYFATCRESLAHALAGKVEDRDMAAAYRDCRGQGLVEGSAAFSTCMLQSKAIAPSPRTATIAYQGAPDTEPGKSYYGVAPHVQFLRARYSCAQLGLVPGSAAFGECVTDLVGALMPMTD